MGKANSFTRFFALGMALLLAATFVAKAQNYGPEPPVHLTGKVLIMEKQPVQADILLKWQIGKTPVWPESFNVYMAEMESDTNTKPEFEKIGNVEADQNKREFSYRVEDVENGIYKFYVTSLATVNGEMHESRPSEIITVTVNKEGNPNEHKIKFVHRDPPRMIKNNIDFKYKFQAESDIKCAIIYKIEKTNITDDYKIDPKTGEFQWIVRTIGEYYIVVSATLACDENISVKREYLIVVAKNGPVHETAKINGRVIYEDSSAVMQGIVVAWKIGSNSDRIGKAMYKAEIQQGTFEMKVSPGKYYLRVEGPEFETEWYEDARELSDATPVVAEENETATLTIIVAKKPEPVHYMATGSVVSDADDIPVMAVVTFIPVQWLYGDRGNYGGNNSKGFSTRTDSEGNYEIKLSDEFVYVAHASPIPEDGYMPQFFNQVDVPTEADLIYLSGDVRGIDFRLKKRIDNNIGFTGRVTGENDEILQATVFAFLVEQSSPGQQKHFMLTTHTDREGYFRFENMAKGKYVLLSIPGEKKFIPGYYVENDFTTLKWLDATRLDVDESMPRVIIEIKHKYHERLKGIGVVNGFVTDNSIAEKSGDVINGNNYIGGSFVYMIDADGNFVDYQLTDNMGAFAINELTEGTYTVYSEKVGYSSAGQTVTVDYEKTPESEINLQMTLAATSGVEVSDGYNDIHVYPMPANEYVNVEFSIEGQVEINLYNSLGELVISDNKVTSKNYRLDTQALPTGTYYLRLSNGKVIKQTNISVIR